jgi:ATP-dependent RNA helicase DHX37/DHR1
MEEIHKLRAQISNIVHTNFPDADAGFTSNLPPPRDIQVKKNQFAHAVCID